MKYEYEKAHELKPTGFLYQSTFVDERFSEIIKEPLPFENCEYELQITGTVSTDKRIMSFVNVFWGFEVTGGYDQFEPLTIISVNEFGMARAAGIRVGDIITRINNVYTDDMTLFEAQMLLLRSGWKVQVFVRGDTDVAEDDEPYAYLWFRPRPKRFPAIKVENKWTGGFPWNTRKKPIYKESNCFMVPSKNEEVIHRHDAEIRQEIEKVEAARQETERLSRVEESVERERTPIIPTESEENVTTTYDEVSVENTVASSSSTTADYAKTKIEISS